MVTTEDKEKIRQIVCNQKSRVFDCEVPISQIKDEDIENSIEVWEHAQEEIFKKAFEISKNKVLKLYLECDKKEFESIYEEELENLR